MRLLGAVFVAFLAFGPLSAQYRSAGGFGGVSGGRSTRGTGHGSRRGNTSGVYAYPVYIGGYGYGFAYGYAPVPPDQPTSNVTQDNLPAQPPVTINQYFGPAPADQEPPPEAAASNFHYYQAPSNNDAAPSDASYYLIAFKDHTIYSAVAYYTEGDTLHYFTSGNVHNQVSVSLVDDQLTEQLNRRKKRPQMDTDSHR
ncbi:MAG: hypothetical protein ABSG56_19340 [Bryobacteraceae bacterium]|jgi:hypothetical protein